ncbi:ABC transporter permease [Clostridium folliculivorans]|uniref:Transport permease protein n=1 Tax=Clostridium folliculivorans TaxID=2886038 RepID=A0A9W5Y448_9CLOT|nr:ABC transporter permease [Clostridium folliculivorans]GKU26209.1 ABC transporter [Clostridium folliculivorans]GKU31881.1 ABC transporter [Clostridium folliculivorans]
MELKKVMRVIRARFIMKAKIYFRYPLNIFFFIVDPIIWLSPFYFMSKVFSKGNSLSGFQAYTGSSDYMGFLVIGFMISAYSGAAMWSVGFSMKDEMMDGVLESNWTAPVNRAILVVSSSIFEFLRCTVEVVVTGMVCHFLFGFNINGNIIKALLYMCPGIISLIGLGLIMASLVLIIKNANTVVDISNSLLSGFSGGYFPIQIFPKYLLPIAFAIPLTYLNDSVRAILVGQKSIIDLRLQFIILCGFMFTLLWLGYFIFMKVEGKCRERGLSGY